MLKFSHFTNSNESRAVNWNGKLRIELLYGSCIVWHILAFVRFSSFFLRTFFFHFCYDILVEWSSERVCGSVSTKPSSSPSVYFYIRFSKRKIIDIFSCVNKSCVNRCEYAKQIISNFMHTRINFCFVSHTSRSHNHNHPTFTTTIAIRLFARRRRLPKKNIQKINHFYSLFFIFFFHSIRFSIGTAALQWIRKKI